MGYDDVVLDRKAFDDDLQWADALTMLEWLSGVAKRAGLSLGVKFSNTLVVKNTRGRLAGDNVYMSGAPLHVIATTLADKFVQATQARFPVSFSAGIDADNFADAVANGFTPVTTCTDLLQPTGYRRLPRYLKALEADMERVGANNIAEYVRARAGVMPTVPVTSAAAMNRTPTRSPSPPSRAITPSRPRPSRRECRSRCSTATRATTACWSAPTARSTRSRLRRPRWRTATFRASCSGWWTAARATSAATATRTAPRRADPTA